ncbi:hypothetical protein A2572_04390 [Candidatus Collierbacteria bacterium RIFOXYD1_FULL_40_9]|uniref:Uncharacterized protein n=1 Tax=Candidatus Collierbacteria bacterium RIFOXYD1_FULL_40_9 TaxID=1817731 RepID=A0A1F5FPQ3_9BACT|nr:MAG: hypothetical protein A2572_04390 [Candidatus Collierbacteria bacterium RIFOXYD1_FULL_40_9]
MTFEDQRISDYLKYESIESVFKKHRYNLPISFAGFARLLNKRGVVTTAGPNSHLSESLYFFSLLKEYGGSIGKLHQKLGLKISTQTLHRVLHNIRFGVTRRYGAALIIENINAPEYFLFGQDSSLHGKLGQKGDWTLPMSHTRQQDSHYTSILRVLQREVFTQQTIYNDFPHKLLNQNLKPIFKIDITDISVSIYHLKIDLKQYQFSSFKLFNYQALNLQEIKSLKTRPGVKEIIENFTLHSVRCNLSSNLNSELQEAYMIK